MTLTKHQQRFHPSGSMNRLPSEDAMSEHSYQGQVAVPIPNEQYPLPQQPYYSHTQTPTYGFYPHQSLHITPVPMQDPPPIVIQHIPITTPVDVQRAQQHYMQPVLLQQLQQLQQQYDPGCQEYLPPDGSLLMVTEFEVATTTGSASEPTRMNGLGVPRV
ncbi:hypothetical protein CBS147321_7475 [Aspergillus niger]|nr:hypothetical protein CBS147321_7475 [Aspergillus niger]